MTTSITLTGRTKQRVANIRRLIAALGEREMKRGEIYEFLHLSPSGGRKYLFDLKQAIEIARTIPGAIGRPGHPVYRLASPEAVKQFLDTLDANAVPYRAKDKRGQTPVGRRFHIMQDDVGFAVKVHRLAVAADPMALPRPFFDGARP